MKLPLSYIETWGTRDAARGRRRHLRARRTPTTCSPSPAPRRRSSWAMQELVGPGDHAVVTVPCYQAMETVTAGDRRRREPPASCAARTAGRSTWTSCAACCAPTTKLVAVNYPNNPTGYVPGRGDLPRARGAVRRARHPPVLRRGLPRHRGRPGADDHAGGRPLRDGRSRSTWPPSPTACPACASAGSPAATAPCSSASRSASTTRRSATPARRST